MPYFNPFLNPYWLCSFHYWYVGLSIELSKGAVIPRFSTRLAESCEIMVFFEKSTYGYQLEIKSWRKSSKSQWESRAIMPVAGVATTEYSTLFFFFISATTKTVNGFSRGGNKKRINWNTQSWLSPWLAWLRATPTDFSMIFVNSWFPIDNRT